MTTRQPTSVDKSTKISVGILGTMLMSAVGGAAYLSSMKTSVDNVVRMVEMNTSTLKEVKNAIQEDSKMVAVLRTEMRALEARVRKLENN